MNLEKIKEYPITSFLEQICQNLKSSKTRFLILIAETAAGKSTVLPLALYEHFEGKILVTEPRRLAALSVAERLSELKQVSLGQEIGYKVHLENHISKNTKLEVVTEAILVRQLQEDPALEKYNVVVLDEFHERSINTDLALAFLKEAMELREDLFVVVMSATIDTMQLQEYLGLETPVMQIPGRQFPVEFFYRSDVSVFQAVLEEITKTKGDILVFLPGIAEIRKTEEELKNHFEGSGFETGLENVEICVLHSSVSLEQQKYVITENKTGKKRIILASAIAETSLTVPGITSVIDCGFARINRLDLNTGMEKLSTETESDFSATQRAGRAGRIQKGRCVRLWSKADPRIEKMPSEILRADLSSFVLECAERGICDIEKLDLLEQPGKSAYNAASELLIQLGLLDEKRCITEKGRNSLKLGLHPRLANIAIETVDLQIVLKYSSYADSNAFVQKRFLEDLDARLKKISQKNGDFVYKRSCSKISVLYGFPDRLAKRISEKGKIPVEFQFPGGKKALLYENVQKVEEWIVAPEVLFGTTKATIFKFEALKSEEVNDWLQNKTKIIHDFDYIGEKVQKFEKTVYGQIVLSSKKEDITAEDYASIWVAKVRKEGLKALPLNDEIRKFLTRAEFYRENVDNICKNANLSLEQELCENVNEWLPSFLIPGQKLSAESVLLAIRFYLEGEKVDKEVPVVIQMENGAKCKVKYEKVSASEDKDSYVIRPVIEIIIQRAFGCYKTPEICGKKVLFRLLSPAQRPLQITDDLENFWKGSWKEICKEMKGRYPKHNWDESKFDKENER